MPTIVFIEYNGTSHSTPAIVGQSVMQAAVNGTTTGIVGECGGVCSCGTCHGYIDSPWLEQLPAPGEAESGLLEGVSERQANSRLTCQIKMTKQLDGMVVRLPKSQG